MKTSATRSRLIDIFRLVFTICVIIAHYKTKFDAVLLGGRWNGHIAVEFFFALSGYLMAAHVFKRDDSDPIYKQTYQFMKEKISRLAPVYYTAFLLFIVYRLCTRPLMSLSAFRTFVTGLFPPLMFLSQQGLKESLAIPFSWYIPAMMVGSLILYPLMAKMKKNFTFIVAPLASLFIACFAMQTYGKLFMLQNDWLGFLYPSQLRAILGLCMGCISHEIANAFKDRFSGRLSVFGRCAVTALSVLLLGLPVIWLIIGLSGQSHPCVLFMFALGIALIFSDLGYSMKGSKFQTKFFVLLGQFSLPLYLGQGFIIKTFPASLTQTRKGIYIYCALCIFMGGGILLLSKALTFAFVKIKGVAKRLCIR